MGGKKKNEREGEVKELKTKEDWNKQEMEGEEM